MHARLTSQRTRFSELIAKAKSPIIEERRLAAQRLAASSDKRAMRALATLVKDPAVSDVATTSVFFRLLRRKEQLVEINGRINRAGNELVIDYGIKKLFKHRADPSNKAVALDAWSFLAPLADRIARDKTLRASITFGEMQSALNDPDPMMRKLALKFTPMCNEAGILFLLYVRAQTDPDQEVKQAALEQAALHWYAHKSELQPGEQRDLGEMMMLARHGAKI